VDDRAIESTSRATETGIGHAGWSSVHTDVTVFRSAPTRPIFMPARDPVCRCGHGRSVHDGARSRFEADCLICREFEEIGVASATRCQGFGE
jgi:hypothetical protein